MPRPRRRGRNKSKRIPWKVIRKHNRRRPATSLERKVHAWLDEDEIEYKKEKAVGKYIHVDIFLEPNVCVELNGCYYHCCKKCFTKKDKRVDQIHAKDAKRLAFLQKSGYKTVVIWECEVNKEPEKARAILRGLASST